MCMTDSFAEYHLFITSLLLFSTLSLYSTLNHKSIHLWNIATVSIPEVDSV